MTEYKAWLQEHREEMQSSLQELIRIPSVKGSPVRLPDGTVARYGKEVQKVYEKALSLGRELGFDVLDADGYGGHIEWKGDEGSEKEDVFAVVTHLDVVPAGEGWSLDPYDPVIRDGRMNGRGTTDDKGPMIASLYAMKALKESGYRPKRTIRLILGLDEETGKEGMNRYLEIAGEPKEGITPDSDFPLICAEKGILNFRLAMRLRKRPAGKGMLLTKMEAGTAPNIVIGEAKAVLSSKDRSQYDMVREKAKQYTEETGNKLRVRGVGSSLLVEAVGRTAHGSTPEKGLNAYSILMDFLGAFTFVNEEANDFIAFYNEKIAFCTDGSLIGCDFTDEASGGTVFNVGLASWNEEMAEFTVNLRYPVTCRSEEIYQALELAFQDTEIGLIKESDDPPFYLPVDDPLIEELLAVYAEETGVNDPQPIVESGGSYAKLFKRVVPFGALLPGQEDRIHRADEYIELEVLDKIACIYAATLARLCCEDRDGLREE